MLPGPCAHFHGSYKDSSQGDTFALDHHPPPGSNPLPERKHSKLTAFCCDCGLSPAFSQHCSSRSIEHQWCWYRELTGALLQHIHLVLVRTGQEAWGIMSKNGLIQHKITTLPSLGKSFCKFKTWDGERFPILLQKRHYYKQHRKNRFKKKKHLKLSVKSKSDWSDSGDLNTLKYSLIVKKKT